MHAGLVMGNSQRAAGNVLMDRGRALDVISLAVAVLKQTREN